MGAVLSAATDLLVKSHTKDLLVKSEARDPQ